MQSENEKIIQVDIESQMKSAYIDYAMSVIVSRALPDIRDGLKPVHRRILFAMNEMSMHHNKPYKKSARIVGEVLGKYHPHGDSSVYDAMVRLAQPWSMRYMLIDGQGNFGSLDNDPPAAMRYTEARLQEISNEILADIEKGTVDTQLNFDDSLEEPVVLPTRVPILLVNGSSGIAVGMATNMPPHNLREVINGIIAYIENEDITIEELMQHIKAPDFPTGGIIYGYDGVKEAFETGRGRVVMRAETNIEVDERGRESIVVSSIPYQINKSEMIKKQVVLVQEKRIEGIVNIKDESNKKGVRVVYELRKDVVANVILNKLYQYSDLQTSFSVNNIALVKGRPMMLNLKDIITHFVDHRIEIVTRRTRYELNEAEKRAHILEGLLKALDFIDEVISIIRNSSSVEEARNALIERFQFSDLQSRAIVDMRLRQLAGLERKKLTDEFNELIIFIQRCKEILENHSILMDVIKSELFAIRDKYGDERRSRIEYAGGDFRIEDTIADEDVVITISHLGYVKRTPLTEYRTQNRGGVGSKGSEVRDEDFVEHIFVASNHNFILLFTEKGKCFWLRAFEIPEGSKVSKGRAIQNLINIEPDDKVKAYINIKSISDTEYINTNYIILCTKKGIIKKTSLEAYSRPRQNGIIAITVREGDELLEAKLTNGSSEVMMALDSGKSIRFNEKTVRPMGRSASGVRGIRLQSEEDIVIGMICLKDLNDHVLVVSENGYGKRSNLEDYRETNRGGKGVKTLNITDKTGKLIAISNVTDENDLMIIKKSGIAIRMPVANLRVLGRATQGVRLINLKEQDRIASITKVPKEEEEIIVAVETPEQNPEENIQ